MVVVSVNKDIQVLIVRLKHVQMNVLFMEYVQPMVYVNASKEEQEKIVASNTVQIIAMGMENVMQKDFAPVKMNT
jgi:hypothetical protein